MGDLSRVPHHCEVVALDAAAVQPVPYDALLPDDRRCALDQLYAGVDHALDQLLDHLGFSQAA
jgi:hypothetical protein